MLIINQSEDIYFIHTDGVDRGYLIVASTGSRNQEAAVTATPTASMLGLPSR